MLSTSIRTSGSIMKCSVGTQGPALLKCFMGGVGGGVCVIVPGVTATIDGICGALHPS